MIAYHRTTVGGMAQLRPFANPHSNLKYPCVYLSTNKALASIYIWKHEYKWMTFEIADDGIPVYNESFEGALREFYGGVEGYIYVCNGEFEVDENTTIKHAVISKATVDIQSVDFVDNAYERILQYEAEGLLRIHHFEERTNRQKERDRNMVLGTIKRLELLKGEHPLSGFVASKFPAIWQEASIDHESV